MARSKRHYGSGSVYEEGRGLAIRWRELEIAPDGTTRRVQRYEALGDVSRKKAAEILPQKIVTTQGSRPTRSLVTFQTHTSNWLKTMLPMYKPSTQKNHRHIVQKHLLARFGDQPLSDVTRQGVQGYVAHLVQRGYAPKTIDHIHDVLSAVLRTAVEWGHLADNPARGVRLPKLKTVRPKWVLTISQAEGLLQALPPLPRAMVGLALLSGLRRGELFALRWKDLDADARVLHVRQAVYEGMFGSPKTEAGLRRIPLAESALQIVEEWKQRVRKAEADLLVFSTRSGEPICPGNVLRRWVFPACTALGLPRATWLTFRRTYSTWAHDKGVPGKVVAQLMGHARVDTTLNVYTQVSMVH